MSNNSLSTQTTRGGFMIIIQSIIVSSQFNDLPKNPHHLAHEKLLLEDRHLFERRCMSYAFSNITSAIGMKICHNLFKRLQDMIFFFCIVIRIFEINFIESHSANYKSIKKCANANDSCKVVNYGE